MMCEGHMQHNETLFKWNLKEISAQFAESSQLWVHAHFSEIFNKKITYIFLRMRKPDYLQIFSPVNDSQYMVFYPKQLTDS